MTTQPDGFESPLVKAIRQRIECVDFTRNSRRAILKELNAIRRRCDQNKSVPDGVMIQPLAEKPDGISVFLFSDPEFTAINTNTNWELAPRKPAPDKRI